MKKLTRRKKRKIRIRKKISGTGKRPRIAVFRSNKHIYVQAIDDEKRVTMASFSDLLLKAKKVKKTKAETAKAVGAKFGEILKKMKIKQAVFDRGGYKYHGRVKALAEEIKKSGIKF